MAVLSCGLDFKNSGIFRPVIKPNVSLRQSTKAVFNSGVQCIPLVVQAIVHAINYLVDVYNHSFSAVKLHLGSIAARWFFAFIKHGQVIVLLLSCNAVYYLSVKAGADADFFFVMQSVVVWLTIVLRQQY